MSEKTKDVLIRALKTFLETAVAYLITNLSGIEFFGNDNGKAFWIGMLLSAGSAGLSAMWNGVIQPAIQTTKGKDG